VKASMTGVMLMLTVMFTTASSPSFSCVTARTLSDGAKAVT
jgi:uncharacterized protein